MKIEYTGRKPLRAHPTDAGMDLYADQQTTIPPGEVVKIGTGTHIAIPEGFFGLLALRSSIGSGILSLANGVGIIDSDYRGELILAVRNNSSHVTSTIYEGVRIGQLVIIPIPEIELIEKEALDVTERNQSGFGSTGTR